jgi:hypothetical protein
MLLCLVQPHPTVTIPQMLRNKVIRIGFPASLTRFSHPTKKPLALLLLTSLLSAYAPPLPTSHLPLPFPSSTAQPIPLISS